MDAVSGAEEGFGSVIDEAGTGRRFQHSQIGMRSAVSKIDTDMCIL